MIFHKGDLVRVVGPSWYHWVYPMDEYIGRTCEVYNITDDSYVQLIDLDYDSVIQWFFKEDDLEFVDDVCKDLCELNIDAFMSLYG